MAPVRSDRPARGLNTFARVLSEGWPGGGCVGPGPPKESSEGDPARDTLREGLTAVHPPKG